MKRNVPKLRFKGFSDEWKEIKLGEFLTFYSTNSFSRDCLNYEKGDVQNIHYGDIHMKFPTILDTEKYSIPYINSDINITKYSEESYCKDGDLVIADASEDYADIGKGIEVCNIGNKKILAGLHTILARDNKQKTVNGFKGYMMQSESVRKQVKVLAAGAKVVGISKSNLEKVNVKLPTLQEQERIANFLTKVDKIIEKQEEKVKNLEKYKKGMMQKIFSQEIRFKDENGKEYPEWEEKKLGEIAGVIMGQSPSSEAYNENYEGIPLIQGNADIKLRKTAPRIYTTEITKTCEIGDIIMSVRAPVGSIGIADHNCCIGRGVCAIKAKINNNYLYQVLLKKENKWSSISQGSTFESINKNDINGLKIVVPSLKEQEKIADFLTKIDLSSQKEYDKLKELKQWKRGLLQQMFV